MEKSITNLGIIGGTFDPVHYGHIGCAQVAADTFNLDEVWFMPANHPNFKLNQDVTDIRYRLDMLKLAIKDCKNPNFKVTDIETKREGTSFTSDTLEILNQKNPGINLYFIVGTDALFSLPKWHQFDKILQLATVVAVTRKGYFNPNREQAKFIDEHTNKIKIIEADVIDASSSKIRQLITEGSDVSKYLPSSVITYIKENKLY